VRNDGFVFLHNGGAKRPQTVGLWGVFPSSARDVLPCKCLLPSLLKTMLDARRVITRSRKEASLSLATAAPRLLNKSTAACRLHVPSSVACTRLSDRRRRSVGVGSIEGAGSADYASPSARYPRREKQPDGSGGNSRFLNGFFSL